MMMRRYRVIASAVFVLCVFFVVVPCGADDPPPKAAPHAEELGWRVGIQAFSLYRSTLYETINAAQSLGVHYIEAIPFQRLSKEKPRVRTNHKMPPEIQAEIKAKLKAADVKLTSYGVVDMPNDESECRAVFDFAKAMGIETIVSEPPPEALALIDKLCEEYGINVAIHNHPEPSPYWNPDTVVEACKGRSKRIGACADTSHWMRSGIDPLEALKKLEGRLLTFHFGEVNREDVEALMLRHRDGDTKKMVSAINKVPNVVWGTGGGDVKAWLAEIKRQEVKAVFSIESFFELKPAVAIPKMAQCIEYFDKAAAELAGE